MLYVVLGLIIVGVWLFCLFDVLTTDETEVRLLPRFGWFLVVLLGFMPGAALWLLLGRPREAAGHPGAPWSPSGSPAAPRPPVPKGPDDDPEFLRSLDRRIRGED
ncbi:Phospholipase_D-nuclease N-terminal [Thermomonospora echinospora]|uniref:Phospholipase_D-nuclease N-terminal n=1 Tax=Thermomonospora echinospora TaxID=1992 RepID=A0A1H5YZI1_9ACTN|nr:PLDc N-terminal domain-containing protein [Thermomonospora echinospora]SEG29673.1 Phospholipase_D-nuclease N-terminal [Thermomonospora echinospora]